MSYKICPSDSRTADIDSQELDVDVQASSAECSHGELTGFSQSCSHPVLDVVSFPNATLSSTLCITTGHEDANMNPCPSLTKMSTNQCNADTSSPPL